MMFYVVESKTGKVIGSVTDPNSVNSNEHILVSKPQPTKEHIWNKSSGSWELDKKLWRMEG